MWIVDVGCHDGKDSAYYLSRGAKVIGVEADPWLCQSLRKRFRTEIEEGQFRLLEGAITEKSVGKDFVTLYKNKEKSVWNTIDPRWAERNNGLGSESIEVKVPVIDIISSLKSLDRIEYIKIDIEGVDLIFLKQLKESSIIPEAISLESNKTDFEGLIEEIETLKDMGYFKFKAIQQFSVPFQSVPSSLCKIDSWDGKFELGSSGLFGRDLSGDWKNAEDILREYRKIFRSYEAFGDESLIRRILPIRLMLQGFERFSGIGLPGWYDTHAIK